MDVAEASLCAAVRGTPGIWRQLAEPAAQSRFLAAAALHRFRPLLGWRLRQSGELPLWPASIRQALADAERAEAALEIVRRQELCRLLQAFAAADVPVLLLKGAALAYSLYPEPWLRPREDTDLLVQSADARRASDVLASAGYRPALMQSGDFVTHQRLHVRSDRTGRRYACDLHWKIANPAPFADLLSPEDLLRGAASVSLGDAPTARIPCRIHALLLACWHRVSHHHDSGDLLWLYDLHLLADGLTGADAAAVLAITRRTGTGAICARGLRPASERFDTRLPLSLLADLETPGHEQSSLPAVYLRPGARKVDLLTAELRALPDWGSRARLLREHLFPPAEYMLGSYGRLSRAALPALYLWRIARGARRWFGPP
jgi:hypothetical protein